ncbi:MAG: hypothetical protein P4L74_03570 [Candidatus Doudnabacteria bacterium]|nr:hypothetical protein [Candidatus Doudnabacteria bacterium]
MPKNREDKMQDNHGYELFCAVQILINSVWTFAGEQWRQLAMYQTQGHAPLPNPDEYQFIDGICLLLSGDFPTGLGTPWGFIRFESSNVGHWSRHIEDLKKCLGLEKIGETSGGLTAYRVTNLSGYKLAAPKERHSGDAGNRTNILINWWILTARYQIDQLLSA